MRIDEEDCVGCFAKNCYCECNTCVSARERNRKFSVEKLDIMCNAAVMSKEESCQKEKTTGKTEQSR